MNIAILVAIIEIFSILIKHFLPKYAKLIPVGDTIITLAFSLITGTDMFTAITAEGISLGAYDLIYGIYKLITGKDKNKLEEKKES